MSFHDAPSCRAPHGHDQILDDFPFCLNFPIIFQKSDLQRRRLAHMPTCDEISSQVGVCAHLRRNLAADRRMCPPAKKSRRRSAYVPNCDAAGQIFVEE